MSLAEELLWRVHAPFGRWLRHANRWPIGRRRVRVGGEDLYADSLDRWLAAVGWKLGLLERPERRLALRQLARGGRGAQTCRHRARTGGLAPPAGLETPARGTGELLALYDAEDLPDRHQLIEAWQRFEQGGENLACVQAPLVVANLRKGMVARMFGFEYSGLFRGILPWLSRMKLMFPLGGTSNHFRRSALVAAGGWDPYNVTEDGLPGYVGAFSGDCDANGTVVRKQTYVRVASAAEPASFTWTFSQSQAAAGTIGSTMCEARVRSTYTVLVAICLRTAMPSGSPVL